MFTSNLLHRKTNIQISLMNIEDIIIRKVPLIYSSLAKTRKIKIIILIILLWSSFSIIKIKKIFIASRKKIFLTHQMALNYKRFDKFKFIYFSEPLHEFFVLYLKFKINYILFYAQNLFYC
jgi:hypothetical protein